MIFRRRFPGLGKLTHRYPVHDSADRACGRNRRDRVGLMGLVFWGLVISVRRILAIHVLALLACLLARPAAQAANIEVKHLDAAGALVIVEGDLELGDIEVFRSKVGPLSKASVAFRSDGGSLLAGIRIGMLIRVKNFNTIVPDAAQCASACAVAWLGGAHRFLGVGSKVGFHAAYVQKAGAATESGPGNAVLGAYLDQIEVLKQHMPRGDQ